MGIQSRMKRTATAAALAAGWWCARSDAAPPVSKPRPRTSAVTGRANAASQMIDIALDENRTLRGRFVDSAGEPIDGAVVTLRQADRVIARSTTLRDGTFEIERVPPGSYRLACGSAAGQVRCWNSGTAPPNAVIDGVTFQDSVVRGQAVLLAPALFGTSAMTTAAASGAAIGGVATYAAITTESGSQPVSEEPVPPPPATTSELAIPGKHLVGRNADGDLIRIRGPAPWTQGISYSTGADLPFGPASP